MATAAEEDGAFRTRPNFKASIEEPCQTMAVLQQRSVENGSPGNSECLTGPASATAVAAAKTVGDGGEERARSMSDIIAEAMRENGVQQQRRVEIINEGDWPRKSQSTSAPTLALVSLSPPPPPPPPPPPSPMPMTSTLKMKTMPSEITVEVTEGQAQREPLAAVLAPPPPASEFPDKTPHSDGVDKSSSRVAVVIPETTARNDIGVARAMAEALLDEGYMAPAASKSTGSGPISPSARVARSDILVTKTLEDMELRSNGGEPSREASSSPHETSSSTIVSNLACSRGVAHHKMSDTKSGAPAGRRGGVDAPFGHAIIIEEHVRAVAETSVNNTRKDADRSMELHVGLNGIHASAMANVGRKSGGKAKASGGSTGPGYSSCTTAGQHEEAQGLTKTAQAPPASAPSAPAVGAPIAAASTTLAEPVAKTAVGDARIGWGAGEAAGVGDGFLSLQGGRSSLTTLASFAGIVARANMSLPSRVGGAAPGRDALKPPSSGSSAPEEFVLLQEEQGAEETGSHEEGDDTVSGTVYGEAGRTFQGSTDPCRVLGGGGLFRLRDSFVGESSVASSRAPATDEEGELVPEASEAVEEGGSLGGGSGDEDGSWAVAPGLDGTGLSEAEGGWGHVDGNECVEEVHYDDEEDRENGVTKEASVGVSNGMPKASSGTKPPLNGCCGVGVNQDPVALKPEPETGETDQSELFVVNGERKPVDELTRNRSICVEGTPARFPTDAVADTEQDIGDKGGSSHPIQEAHAALAVTAVEEVVDTSDPSASAPVEGTHDEGEFEERLDGVSGVEQAWGELVEGVVKEKVPGSELPKPDEVVGADDTTLTGVAFARDEVRGDENGSTVSEHSGDDKCLLQDGCQSNREESQPGKKSRNGTPVF